MDETFSLTTSSGIVVRGHYQHGQAVITEAVTANGIRAEGFAYAEDLINDLTRFYAAHETDRPAPVALRHNGVQ